jgi:short subunit dehydrogenase-like uncharacterized protein
LNAGKGRFVCRYLKKRSEDYDLRWAIAGRSKAKLEALIDREGLGRDVAVLIADSDDEASLAELAKSTTAMITTVAIFSFYFGVFIKD